MADAPVDTAASVPLTAVGAGPAGLMPTHRLGRAEPGTIVLDTPARRKIETTQRAGILETDAARHLVETGAPDRRPRAQPDAARCEGPHRHSAAALGREGGAALDEYRPRALQRVWRAQSFSS